MCGLCLVFPLTAPMLMFVFPGEGVATGVDWHLNPAVYPAPKHISQY